MGTAHTESSWVVARPVAVHKTTLIQQSPLIGGFFFRVEFRTRDPLK